MLGDDPVVFLHFSRLFSEERPLFPMRGAAEKLFGDHKKKLIEYEKKYPYSNLPYRFNYYGDGSRILGLERKMFLSRKQRDSSPPWDPFQHRWRVRSLLPRHLSIRGTCGGGSTAVNFGDRQIDFRIPGRIYFPG